MPPTSLAVAPGTATVDEEFVDGGTTAVLGVRRIHGGGTTSSGGNRRVDARWLLSGQDSVGRLGG